MRFAKQTFVTLIVANAAGCDGYSRTLYLQPPGMARPPWGTAATAIAVSGDDDVPRLVSDVAAALGLAYDARFAGYTTAVGSHDSFTMSAAQEAGGRWVIRLLDWPSFTRSRSSVDAENAVRKALAGGAYHGGRPAGVVP